MLKHTRGQVSCVSALLSQRHGQVSSDLSVEDMDRYRVALVSQRHGKVSSDLSVEDMDRYLKDMDRYRVTSQSDMDRYRVFKDVDRYRGQVQSDLSVRDINRYRMFSQRHDQVSSVGVISHRHGKVLIFFQDTNKYRAQVHS